MVGKRCIMKKEINMRCNVKNTIKEKTETNETKSRINTDPFGSWTGVVEGDVHEKPVQDVDDL